MSDMLTIFTGLTIITTRFGISFASPENTPPSQRDTQSPVFLQEPPFIPYYVTFNKSVNLTWVAMNVCRIRIKCNGKKFKDRLLSRVCGKSCRGCRTRTKTKIVTVADFPKAVRNTTCRCTVWGKKAVRQSDIIPVEKAFLRLHFGRVQLRHVVRPNTTVVLKCKPPYGSPRPNITWYKIGKPSVLLGHDGRRRISFTPKKDLVINRAQVEDSGEYQCEARNMVARRVGLVIRLDVRENISAADCQEHQWPCTEKYSPKCQNGSNRSFNCGENRNKSGPNNPTVVVLLIAILVLVVLDLVISFFKKPCPCQTSQDPPHMTRRSTNLDKHDDDDDWLELTDQTELECTIPCSNNKSSNIIGQGSGEPSGSVAACGDSSVASPRGLVAVYVTKVEVEQHGGVTVVGDDTKVHHHYSPQS